MRIRFPVALLFGLVVVPGVVRAGPIPEPTPGIPPEKSVACRTETPPTIDGDLSDWEGAVFKLIGRQQDVFRGEWAGPDDLTCIWSVMWDDTTFYFAAVIRDDILVDATDPQQPWTGDCVFLYIDADADGTIDNKPCFFLLDGKPAVLGMAGGAEPGTVDLAIVTEPRLGKAGRILEAAIPLDCLTNMQPAEGVVFRMMPGYEEGTQGAEAPPTFLDWDGLDPDNAANLRQVIFGGATDTDPWARARTPDPPDGTTALVLPLFRWTAGDGAVLHNVYLGRSPDLGPADLAAARISLALHYYALPLEAGTTYYWRVDEIEADGQTIHTGTVWSFTTQAMTAYKPSPGDGACAVSPATALAWLPGQAVVEHHLYFSDSAEAVHQGAAEADKGLLTDPTFTPEGLQTITTYYWRVDEVTPPDVVRPGNVWSFTTYLPVDDFESYNDEEGKGTRIYETWVDGWADGSSGSRVGYLEPPFAERKTVHGGVQSMPMDYNNVNSPYESRTQRTFAPPVDWTVHDANMLVLHVRGRTTNQPATLYLAIDDASNHNARTISNDETMVTTAKWNEWRVPVELFSARGVDMTRVKKLTLGVYNGPGPGGTGTLYFDDIYVMRAKP
jgi:hypothetical protein